MVYTKKFCTLNTTLIPTPVTPPDAPRWIRQRATVPKGNESTKVEGKNFNHRTYHATTIQARGMKMQKLKHPFQKSYITFEIHSTISLQDNTSKNLIQYTSFTVGLQYTKSFQNTVFYFQKCSPNIYKISSRPTPQTSPLASPSSGSWTWASISTSESEIFEAYNMSHKDSVGKPSCTWVYYRDIIQIWYHNIHMQVQNLRQMQN